ncbi:hypothetical protein CYMTET_44648 [Cymbomonas tetramitiformis]|uniref:Uncharacterized protein n=1 Tax=Cymbomonas tetramitiformis TaxID=36881 RepID=A0AAE0EZE8_9CHLO|nr:hypothetical protein CYMTET_44648 [Cymbomonas tetramitiformis]|eukprot:gene29159-36260_t
MSVVVQRCGRDYAWWLSWAGIQNVSMWSNREDYSYHVTESNDQACTCISATSDRECRKTTFGNSEVPASESPCKWLDDPGVCLPTGERNAVWNVELDGRQVTGQIVTNMFTGRKYMCVLNFSPPTAAYMCSQKTCRYLVFRSVDTNLSEIVVLFPSGRYVAESDSKETLRDMLDQMVNRFYPYVRDLEGYDRILFCGHSMGAVLAQMTLLKWLSSRGGDARAYACGSGAYQWANQTEVDALPHERMHFVITKFTQRFRASVAHFGDDMYKVRADANAVFMKKSAYVLHVVNLVSLAELGGVELLSMDAFFVNYKRTHDAELYVSSLEGKMTPHYWSTYLRAIAQYLRDQSA